MASDFHTHLPLPQTAADALVSLPYPVSPEDAAKCRRYSLQFHPWDLPAQRKSLPDGIAEALQAATALGEVGLDRLRGPELAVQSAFLKELLDLAEALGKPVVFHVVRAWPEFFSIAGKYSFRKLVHGFFGNPRRLQELLAREFFVSLSPKAFTVPGMAETLQNVPWDRLGFESDASGVPVAEIIQLAEQWLRCSGLEAKTDAAFRHFIGAE